MAPSTPITLADVRAALGDTDPNQTNAGALRQITGRGSYATLQKHLDTIRAERAPAPAPAPGAAPAPPPDAMAAIWGAAWGHAQSHVLGRLEVLSSERDAALALAATRAQDISALSSEIDALESAAQAADAAHAQELSAADKGAQVEALQASLATAQAEIERLVQAAALTARDVTIERQTLQSALDRQLDKYTELKAMVSHLTPTTPKKHA